MSIRVGHTVRSKLAKGPPPDDSGDDVARVKLRECVVLSGGISAEPTHAVAGALTWHKAKKEKLGDFIDRAKREACDSGERVLTVRGLRW